MNKGLRRVMCLVLVLVISVGLIHIDRLNVAAAPGVSGINIVKIKGENAILYQGVIGLFSSLYVEDATIGEISMDGPITNEVLERHTAAYCLQYGLVAPAINEGAANISGNKYVSELDGEFPEEVCARVTNVLKWGYPATRDYWYENGVKDYYVQQVITQLAIWYITSNRSYFDAEYQAKYMNGDDDGMMKQLTDTFNGEGYVVSEFYPESQGALDMLNELVKCANDPVRQIEESTTKVSIKAYTEKASKEWMGDYKYQYRFGVNVKNADKGLGTKIIFENLSGKLPEAYSVWIMEEGSWKELGRCLDETGTFVLSTERDIETDVVFTTNETGVNITATASVPRIDADRYYYLSYMDDSYQKVLRLNHEYRGVEAAAKMMGAGAEGGRIKLYKKADLLSGISDSTFEYNHTYVKDVVFEVWDNEQCIGKPVEIMTTDKDGYAVSKLLPLGRYYIKERETAAYNYIDDTVYEALLADGKGVSEIEYKLTVDNYATRYTGKAYKRDKKDKPVKGAVIGLFASEDILDYQGNVIVKKDELIKKDVTGDNGAVTFTGLVAGISYYAKELDNPTGYALNEEKCTLYTPWTSDNAEEIITDEVTIVDDYQTGKLNIYKTGEVLVGVKKTESGYEFVYGIRNVSGAVFGIWKNEACEGEPLYKTTVMEGLSQVSDIPLGKWYVKEMSSYPGGIMDTNVYTVKLDKKNTSETIVENDIHFKNERKPVVLTVKKLDKTTNLPLKDVAFELVANEDIADYNGVVTEVVKNAVVRTVITDDNGQCVIDDLPYGYTFTLREIAAPAPYIVEGLPKTITGSSDIVIYNDVQRASVRVIKTDGKTTKLLKGAVFGLYNSSDKLIEKSISDENGVAKFKTLITVGDYYVRELEAPEGYATYTEKIPVNYKFDNSNQPVVNIELNVTDKKTQILIAKKDGTGIRDQLAGAVISICENTDAKKVLYTFTSEDKPKVIEGIVPGIYILREELSPWGFLVAKEKEIVVKDTSEIQYFELVDEAVLGNLTYNYNSIDAVKLPISVETEKVPETGDEDFLVYLVMLFVSGLLVLAFKRKSIVMALCVIAVVMVHQSNVKASEIVESDVMYDEFTFDDSIKKDGKEYELISTTRIDLPDIRERMEHVTERVSFMGTESVGKPENELLGEAYDTFYGKLFSENIAYRETVIDREYWSDDFAFDIDVVINGPYISIADTIIEYNEATPGLLTYGEYILETMGLDTKKYTIGSIVWKGDTFTVDGVLHRIAVASGSRFLTDYTDVYEGYVHFPDITGRRKYVGTYELKKQPVENVTVPEQEISSKPSIESEPETTPVISDETAVAVKPIVSEGNHVSPWFMFGAVFVIIVVAVSLLWYNINQRRKGVIRRQWKKEKSTHQGN